MTLWGVSATHAFMPESAVIEPDVQATAAVEPTPEAVEPAAAEVPQQTAGEIMEALFEARTIGDGKEASRLTELLDKAQQAPAIAEPVEPVEAVTPEPEPTLEPTPEPAESITPPVDPEEGKEPNRLRITHLSEADKSDQIAIHALTKKGMPLAEAYQRILGPMPTTAAAPVEPEPASPTLQDLESTVTNLEAQIDQIAAEGVLFGPEQAKLTKELSRANAKLEAAKTASAFTERENARETSSFEAERSKVDSEVRKEFPAVNDESTELFQLYRDLALAAHSPNHPDHAKAQSVDAPRFFITKAAKILGTKPTGTKAPATAVPPVPAAQPPPATRPAAATKGSAPPPPAKTSADKRQDAEAEFEAASTGRAGGSRRIGGTIIR